MIIKFSTDLYQFFICINVAKLSFWLIWSLGQFGQFLKSLFKSNPLTIFYHLKKNVYKRIKNVPSESNLIFLEYL